MDSFNTPTSRKSIITWLKSLPYSQNLNDGVLFCKVIQNANPAFPKYNENPRSEYQCLRNFKVIQKFLEKENLYRIEDISRLAHSKDYFEFGSWLYGYYVKNLPTESLTQSNIIQVKSAHEVGGLDHRFQSNQPVDLYQEYKHDTKNLLVLSAREQDVQYLQNMIADMKKIISEGNCAKEIRNSIKQRFYGNSIDMI